MKKETLGLPSKRLLKNVYKTNFILGSGPIPCQVMVVGNCPGRQDAESLKPFSSKAGRMLSTALLYHGLRKRDMYLTYAFKQYSNCHRTPSWKALQAHREFLMGEIAAVQPEVLVLLGKDAARCFYNQRHLPSITALRMSAKFENGIQILHTYDPNLCYGTPIYRSRLIDDLKVLSRFRKTE